MTERTSAPTGSPYYMKSTAYGECVWYVYYRCVEFVQEVFGLDNAYPCYRNRTTKSQGFASAKYWLTNYREKWMPRDIGYTPVAGDVGIFDGNSGHVIFIERVNSDGTALISQYNLDGYHKFSNANWTIGQPLKGKYASTGKLLGYLHYEGNEPTVNYETLYNELKAKVDKLKEILA